jgi:ADP-ribose pyrophosphatase YjhB (NUDIX family)
MGDASFDTTARTRTLRVSVRSICIHAGALLVQRDARDPRSHYAFIGGGLEAGERMEDRVRAEYLEEAGREVVRAEYLFVVENRVRSSAGIHHSLEHYFRVDLDSYDVRSREPHLVQSWLPLAAVAAADLRPHVVRDAIADGSWRTVKHLVVPFA